MYPVFNERTFPLSNVGIQTLLEGVLFISSTPQQVLSDAGDLTGAYVTAEALVDSASLSGTDNLELVTARMIASHEEFSDRSLGLFSKIAARYGPGERGCCVSAYETMSTGKAQLKCVWGVSTRVVMYSTI